jgi:hypothetical protein
MHSQTRCFFEGFHELRFDMHMHMNDVHLFSLFCFSAFPMIFAEVRTETVNPKKGPKSCPAGMLVKYNPFALV